MKSSPHSTSNLASPQWTSREDAVLLARYEREGPNACMAALPGRSKHSVKKRAETLGLRCKPSLNAEGLARLQRVCAGGSPEDLEQLAKVTGMRVQHLRQLATQHGWTWPGRILPRPWSTCDDVELAELYASRTLAECAERTGRAPEHVKQRIKKLGLSKREREWSPADDRRLAEIYATRSSAECATLLDRTRQAVLTRVHVLGLTVKTQPRPVGTRQRRRSRAATRDEFERDE